MKTKIIAVLMATIIAMAMVAPMAIADPDEAGSFATVENTCPAIAITDGPGASEVLSNCPNTTTFTFSGDVSDNNGWDTIDCGLSFEVTNSTSAVVASGSCAATNCTMTNVTATSGTFECSFDLPCCTPEGDYTINATITDGTCPISDTLGFHIESIAALAINFNNVKFGTGSPCDDLLGVEYDNGNIIVSEIHSIGNDPIDVGVEAGDLDGGSGNVIDGSEMKADVDLLGKQVIKPEAFWNTNLGCCETTSIDFWLHIPTVPPGDYKGQIWITAYHANKV